MKVYAFGEPDAPAIVLLPGTCCDWKGNFETVIPLLKERYRVLCVSYDGFDRNEAAEFPTMLEETEKIEDYIKRNCGGHIRAAYGCSLGGSFGRPAGGETENPAGLRHSRQFGFGPGVAACCRAANQSAHAAVLSAGSGWAV